VATDLLHLSLQYLKGVGPRKAADLKKAGLLTVEDLLFRFPIRYEDRSRLQPIISIKPGQTVAISGEVLSASLQTTRRAGFRLFTALVQDASGQIQAVWPNQAFLKDVIRTHQRVVLFGKAEYWGSRGMQITDPEFEILRDDESPEAGVHTGRIVPVYERTGTMRCSNCRRRCSIRCRMTSAHASTGRRATTRSSRRISPPRAHRLTHSTPFVRPRSAG
jgi:ATP-dependent DNA helicase RecG